MKALLNSLTESERMLVRETESAQVADLDEDQLMALHVRVRRGRDKYVKLYRREASAKVAEYGGRGVARPKNTRNRERAEVFEDALSRVSRRLAQAARQSAMELRSERIEAARRDRGSHPVTAGRPAPTPRTSQRSRPVPSSRPDVRKRQAASRAKGARRQAKRDSRQTTS